MAEGQARMDKQLSLFGVKSLNPVAELKREMALAARRCGMTRPQIVDRMNVLIGIERLRTRGKDGLVTEAMLDKWLAADSLDSVTPIKLMPIFCRVTGSLTPLATLARPLGAEVIGPEDIILLEMARAQVAKKKAARKERRKMEQYEELVK